MSYLYARCIPDEPGFRKKTDIKVEWKIGEERIGGIIPSDLVSIQISWMNPAMGGLP